MQFFIVVQDGLKDDDPCFSGPFSSLGFAEKEAENQCEPESGFVVTILAQDKAQFRQVSQAIFDETAFPWVRAKK